MGFRANSVSRGKAGVDSIVVLGALSSGTLGRSVCNSALCLALVFLGGSVSAIVVLELFF